MKTSLWLCIACSFLALSSTTLRAQGAPQEEVTLYGGFGSKEYDAKMAEYRQAAGRGMSIRLGDLVDIVGEENIKLTGFGVVTGLNKTGDSNRSVAGLKMLLEIAKKQGILIDPNDVKQQNVALVTISANVNPHKRTFDIAVKSMGDAKSLQNGYLEGSTLSPIGSNEIYAVASGALALGSRYFESTPASGTVGGAASLTIGHPTMGYVLDGGQLVKELPSKRVQNGILSLIVKYPNDRTATNIANAVNQVMGPFGIQAQPANASTINIFVPKSFFNKDGEVTRLLADLADLPASVGRKATITIDQGSGVVAMTEGVKMEPGSISIAGLTITVSSDITPITRQGLLNGDTKFIDQPQLQVAKSQANFLTVPAGTDLRKVQETLNALKLNPITVISVFIAMHNAGMIHADIIVIPR